MNTISSPHRFINMALRVSHFPFVRAFFAGLLLPLGFAPFHLPGLAILGIALFFVTLRQEAISQSFFSGFSFGLGFLGVGVSWVFVSIHDYGHLHPLLCGFITGLFVCYLALYFGLLAIMQKLINPRHWLLACLCFSGLWCLMEYLRATVLTGFPWLLLGFGQVDTPLGYCLPVIGVYGVSFLTCLSATLLAALMLMPGRNRFYCLLAFVSILLFPLSFKHHAWTQTHNKPLSVGVVQANLSMRDKWDDQLFWQLLQHYETAVQKLIPSKQLIILPESAIPLPPSYLQDFLAAIDHNASHHGSAVLLGIPQPSDADHTNFYNSLIALGKAKGHYLKKQLVPFGEYNPKPFAKLMNWLAIPAANFIPGALKQTLMKVQKHAIATLICYELAYPALLRQQLPRAQWIISISDDGWFGHSLAMYQHLQMAQALSLQVGRFQVMANNDGLSSIISPQGAIESSLPAFTEGVLEGTIRPSTGATPWVMIGDKPVLLTCLLLVLLISCGTILPFRTQAESPLLRLS